MDSAVEDYVTASITADYQSAFIRDVGTHGQHPSSPLDPRTQDMKVKLSPKREKTLTTLHA